jgi:hypothetical protein
LQTWIIYHEKLSEESFVPDTNVFYQYKALHCTMEEAQTYIKWGGPARPQVFSGAEYDDNSSPGTVFTKQSNDNNVYSEIAHSGIVQLENGQKMFVFAGE